MVTWVLYLARFQAIRRKSNIVLLARQTEVDGIEGSGCFVFDGRDGNDTAEEDLARSSRRKFKELAFGLGVALSEVSRQQKYFWVSSVAG
jgi:hypothetical protein